MSAPELHPHAGEPVVRAGPPLESATAALILVHGRGSSAADIMRIGPYLLPEEPSREGFALIAPQASFNTWYPHRFLEPVERNEPYVTSALQVVDDLVTEAKQAGLDAGHILLAGFSQGACLSLEFAARWLQPVGGVIALSGGLLGPLEHRRLDASLAGLEVLLGCGDADHHIPIEVAERSAALMTGAGASVDFRRYNGMPHTINDDELSAARALIRGRVAG